MSSSVLNMTRKVRQRFVRDQGLIGVDLGARSIKLAQVERTGNSWKLIAAHVVPIRGTGDAVSEQSIEAGLIATNLESFSTRQSGFRGRRAACALSTHIVEPRVTEMPEAPPEELRQMILQDDQADNCELEFWTSPAITAPGKSQMLRVSTYSLPTSIGLRCAKDLRSAKLQCERIDALPFAMARAIQVIVSDDDQPVAAFDWGHQLPMISVSVNGIPKLTRILRTCSMQRISQAVQSGLGVNEFEAAQLLAAISDTPSANTGRVSEAVHRIIAPEIERVGIEIQKTLDFIHQQHIDLLPRKIWMFGGGGTIGGVSKVLTEQVGVLVRPWSMPADLVAPKLRTLRHQCLFGAAVGLSVPADNS
jgi:Tfp pilus assembly PilM family ATPase